MNWITLACELMALWSLGRIGYWRAFPLFYAKLGVVTVVYSLQNPYSEAWWDKWWAPFHVVIVLLMIGSAVEAFKKFTAYLESHEARPVFWALTVSWFITLVGCLLPGWRHTIDATIFMTRVLFAVEASLTIAMLGALVYGWYTPFRTSLTAAAHFWLLTMLNLSCFTIDLLFRLMPYENEIPWHVAHGMFTCSYCILLILWALHIPRVIKYDAAYVPSV